MVHSGIRNASSSLHSLKGSISEYWSEYQWEWNDSALEAWNTLNLKSLTVNKILIHFSFVYDISRNVILCPYFRQQVRGFWMYPWRQANLSLCQRWVSTLLRCQLLKVWALPSGCTGTWIDLAALQQLPNVSSQHSKLLMTFLDTAINSITQIIGSSSGSVQVTQLAPILDALLEARALPPPQVIIKYKGREIVVSRHFLQSTSLPVRFF